MKNLLYHFLIGILALTALVVMGSLVKLPGSVRLYSVTSGSMFPTIPAGSLVFVKSSDFYAVGDIISFEYREYRNNKEVMVTTTHRIISIIEEADGVKYLTKGDANEVEDVRPVNREDVVGKTIFLLPVVGRIVSFAKTQLGLIVLIVIPATLIVYTELINIKNEAKKLIVERRKRKLSAREKIVEAIGEEEIKIEKEAKKELRGLKRLFAKIVKI